MIKKKQFFKKYKLNKLKKIIKNYKYIYFFRYNDLNINEILFLKKTVKKLNYKSLILTQNLITQVFSKLKIQGSILLIYGTQDLNLIQNLCNLKKITLLYLIIQKNIFSYFKINKIVNQTYLPLNNLIVYPFLNFIYSLRKI